MRIVLDTNVIIATFATRGLCAEIFEICLLEHNIVSSEHILSETKEKLMEKLRLTEKEAENIIVYLKENTVTVVCKDTAINVCRDNDNNKIIETAVSGSAEIIITGDKDLLTIKDYKGIKIISPRDFWELMRDT